MTHQPNWWDSSSRSSSAVNTFGASIGDAAGFVSSQPLDWNQSLLDGGDSSGVYALLGSDQHHTRFINNTYQYSDSIDNTNELLFIGDTAVKKSGETTSKRPRNDSPLPLPAFKVRKEKMGDRISALQQLVSPFGKTDTASVLSEAIEYIKFLHEQVDVLSTPYIKSGHQQSGKECEELKSRGLCLVPVSSTFPVAHDTTVDFWTPTFGGTFR